MKSLRGRLLLGMALGTTAVLVVSGILLYALISRSLYAEFDELLVEKAHALAALTEQDEDGLSFELEEVPLPKRAASQQAEYFQLWRPDGGVLARSPSLKDRNLDKLNGTFETPSVLAAQLPDGQAGRMAGMTFVPRQEEHGRSPGPPLRVSLVFARATSGLQGTLAGVSRILIGVCLASVLIACGMLTLIVRQSLRPVQHLTAQISDVAADDLSTRIHASGVPTELLPVVERLNDLLARVESAFQRERRFTGDVAHELRTPLAGLRSKLELALSRDREPQMYRQTMDDCRVIGLQMQRLVENLLHLARADAGQLELRWESIDLPALVRACWQPLEARAHARGLTIEWHDGAIPPLVSDTDKLHLVIQNLLDNTVAHANDRGHITVSTRTDNGRVELVIGNTGSTVPGDAVQNVFDRFWRGDASFRPSGETHCGLGLPLCKAIVEQLGGTIAAASSTDGVFTVKICL